MSEDTTVAVLEQPTSSAERPVKPAVPTWQHGFWSLVVTQFQGAFNDNAYKNLVVFLILGTGLAKADRDRLVLVAGALFSVPFILFSMTGGFLADRFSKRTVTIGTKLFEIAVMLLAAAGLAWQNLHLEMAAIFLASTQAAFFGPSKYGLLPELLPEPKLSWGNGVIELGTFLAAIAGLVSGAFLADVFHGRQGWSGLIFIGLSLAGLLFSLGIAQFLATHISGFLELCCLPTSSFMAKTCCTPPPRARGFFRLGSRSASASVASQPVIFRAARSSTD
jgi:MFS family permease